MLTGSFLTRRRSIKGFSFIRVKDEDYERGMLYIVQMCRLYKVLAYALIF